MIFRLIGASDPFWTRSKPKWHTDIKTELFPETTVLGSAYLTEGVSIILEVILDLVGAFKALSILD